MAVVLGFLMEQKSVGLQFVCFHSDGLGEGWRGRQGICLNGVFFVFVSFPPLKIK